MEWRETPIASTREAMSLWAVAPERCNSCVKELALRDTCEARCATKRTDGMGGNLYRPYQGADKPRGLSTAGRSAGVSSMPLNDVVRREASRQDATPG
jgi:hypothetical protein